MDSKQISSNTSPNNKSKYYEKSHLAEKPPLDPLKSLLEQLKTKHGQKLRSSSIQNFGQNSNNISTSIKNKNDLSAASNHSSNIGSLSADQWALSFKKENDLFLAKVDEIRVRLYSIVASPETFATPTATKNQSVALGSCFSTESNKTLKSFSKQRNCGFSYSDSANSSRNQYNAHQIHRIKENFNVNLFSRRSSLPVSVFNKTSSNDSGMNHSSSVETENKTLTIPDRQREEVNQNDLGPVSVTDCHSPFQLKVQNFIKQINQVKIEVDTNSRDKLTHDPLTTMTKKAQDTIESINDSQSLGQNYDSNPTLVTKLNQENSEDSQIQNIDKGKYFVFSDLLWETSANLFDPCSILKASKNNASANRHDKFDIQSMKQNDECFEISSQNLSADPEISRHEVSNFKIPDFESAKKSINFSMIDEALVHSPLNLVYSSDSSEDVNCNSGSENNKPVKQISQKKIYEDSIEPVIQKDSSQSKQEVSSKDFFQIDSSLNSTSFQNLLKNESKSNFERENLKKSCFHKPSSQIVDQSHTASSAATTSSLVSSSFLPTFQNALANAAAAAAMQQTNPNQFGQIFGLNYFNTLSAQPPAFPNERNHTSQHPVVAHSSGAAHMAQSFPFHFLASVNQAAVAAAAAAAAAATSTGLPPSHSHSSNVAAQTLAMLAASTQTNPASEFDQRFLIDHVNKDDLELKAKDHREAASRVNECESVYSITRFDFKPPADAIYSIKVFLGGVPWDMNNDEMMEVFHPFGAESIQRPGKDVRLSRASQGLDKAGYLYLIFESDTCVNRLIESCKLELSENGHKYFYNLTSKRSKKEKRVQVIPWNTADSCCVLNPLAKVDQSRTVFLGALHGMMNAQSIAQALTLIFGQVEYVSLDTDKYKYPMGSGQAMFATEEAYFKAISAGFVRVKSDRFEKTIQIDQFLDDCNCFRCCYEKGPVFCKACVKYYCKNCWNICHLDEISKKHPILMKTRLNSK